MGLAPAALVRRASIVRPLASCAQRLTWCGAWSPAGDGLSFECDALLADPYALTFNLKPYRTYLSTSDPRLGTKRSTSCNHVNNAYMGKYTHTYETNNYFINANRKI